LAAGVLRLADGAAPGMVADGTATCSASAQRLGKYGQPGAGTLFRISVVILPNASPMSVQTPVCSPGDKHAASIPMLNRLLQLVHYRRSWKSHVRPHRGVAVLLVLLLITLTLALSYAAIRTQNMSFMVQRNSDRRAVAQQTAVTGMTMALKKCKTAVGRDSVQP